eukprot:TRINITY_DN7351_c0_g1_i2.p1 TRINITY_DN7351_c0_g1~~TRINITY_DN7351_c0_g1_i2.p1  ORF type:complete len:423 (+),score=25.21 TRINITY_DN7351_c0_g1_i2:1-1269(+)
MASFQLLGLGLFLIFPCLNGDRFAPRLQHPSVTHVPERASHLLLNHDKNRILKLVSDNHDVGPGRNLSLYRRNMMILTPGAPHNTNKTSFNMTSTIITTSNNVTTASTSSSLPTATSSFSSNTSTTNQSQTSPPSSSLSQPSSSPTTHVPTTSSPLLFNSTISPYYLAPALPGLLLSVVGYRVIGATLFLAGGVIAGGAWWVFSPKLFPDTSFCCGSHGTVLGHVVISIVAGIVGGLLARWAWRVGIFHIGMCFGLLIGLLVMLTPAEHARFFNSDAAVLCFYVGCMTAGGILTMLFRKFFVILTTATAGILLFLLGIDYFVQSHLGKLLMYLAHRIEVAVHKSIKHDTIEYQFDGDYDYKAFIMVFTWLVLTLVAMVIQYVWSSKTKTETQKIMIYGGRYPERGGVSEEIEMEQRAALIQS